MFRRLRMIQLFGAMAAMLIVLADRASADDLHVPGEYPTIQAAIDAASDGDTVLVCPGTYHEMVDLSGKAISLRSLDGAESTTIDADDAGIAVTCDFSDGPDPTEPIILDGFTITGGAPAGGDQPGGMYVQFCSPLIQNCVFESNTGNDGGGLTIVGGSATIIGCAFHDNAASDGGAVEHREDSGSTFINCVFYHNRANIGANPCGGAIRNGDSFLHLLNCTFYENHANLDGGAIANIRGTVLTENCVFWADTPNEIANLEGGVTTVRYSCIAGGWGGPGEGNHGVDPSFANASNGVLRLSSASPCIDAGDTSALPAGLFVDLDGWGRVCNDARTIDTGVPAALVPTTVDMGAYEYFFVGDLDRDDDVDLSDLAALLANYGM